MVQWENLITSAFAMVGFRNRRYDSFYWENRRVRCSGGQLEFAANKVEDVQKKDAFLCCIGRDTYGLLRALMAPNKPTACTYQQLTDALIAQLGS